MYSGVVSTSTANILYTVSKRPLQTTDIFLFNNTRATRQAETETNYCMLEHIKDGCATSTKYNSMAVNFKTPNTLIVFSIDQICSICHQIAGVYFLSLVGNYTA